MKYSEHFSDYEFRVSADHPLVAKIMIVPKYVKESFKWASPHVLEPARAQISEWKGNDTPFTITSAYRSFLLNKLVGGYKHSHHMTGHAADITFEGIEEFHSRAPVLLNKIPALQYILIYRDKNFWHLGFQPDYQYIKRYEFK